VYSTSLNSLFAYLAAASGSEGQKVTFNANFLKSSDFLITSACPVPFHQHLL